MPREDQWVVGAEQTPLPTTRLLMAHRIIGTEGSPIPVVGAAGVINIDQVAMMQTHFIESDGGVVDISNDPQIATGAIVGQILNLMSTSNANTLKFEDATGLELVGQFIMAKGHCLTLMWNGALWREMFRNA